MAAYGNMTAAPPGYEPKERPTVQGAIQDFDAVIDRMAIYADRLNTLNIRVHGPTPTGGANPEKKGEPVSLIAMIQDRRSRIVAILDDIERSIAGLENIL